MHETEEKEKNVLTLYCVICREEISANRVKKKAVTCSEAHALELKNRRRRVRDMTRCHFCSRPTTPAERADFLAWRRQRTNQPKRGRPKTKKAEEGA